jgi:hypothetical protein
MGVSAAAEPALLPAADDPRSTLLRFAQSRLLQVAVALLLLAGGAVFLTGLAQEVIAVPAATGHHDFLAFHAAARLVGNGTAAGHLYDAASITALERQVISTPVGAAGYMPYINPPFGAALQAPLGLLSEPTARIVWLLISIAAALVCCWLATAALGLRARVVAIACLLGTFPFYQAFVEGQWSFVMLTGCLGALLAARAGRPGWAGVGLATLALKPPLLVPVLVVLLFMRAWRTAMTCVGAVLAVWLVTLPFTGWSTQLDYAGYLVSVVGSHLDGAGAAGAAVWHGGLSGMEAINGLAAGYVGQQNVVALDAITVVGVLAVVAWWAVVARRSGISLDNVRGRWVVVAGIAAALLTDLHLYPQDCVLVLVALPLLTDTVQLSLRLPLVLGLAVFLDLAWLDQLAVTPHVFTWLLALGFLWASARALGVDAPLSSAIAVLRRVQPRRSVAGSPS